MTGTSCDGSAQRARGLPHVKDSTAAIDVRVGAAIALWVADQAGAADRIWIAADATVAPEPRMLLQ